MKIRLIQEHDFWRWVLKVLKGQENLLLKILQVKTCIENVRFLSWRIFFVGKYGIQSTNEMAFKRIVTLRASFRFPAIRFDGPTLLSFSGFTHAHAKCPPVVQRSVKITLRKKRWHAAGRENFLFFPLPTASRLSRVGWFLRALAFRLLYYPWGQMGDYP